MDKIPNFIDVSFPARKVFDQKLYRRYLTFPCSKRSADSFVDLHKSTYTIKVIPVIEINGDNGYMIYVRKKKGVK